MEKLQVNFIVPSKLDGYIDYFLKKANVNPIFINAMVEDLYIDIEDAVKKVLIVVMTKKLP